MDQIDLMFIYALLLQNDLYRFHVIIHKYANCVYFVIVATEFFTNWNAIHAIEGLGRGDFRTVSVI